VVAVVWMATIWAGTVVGVGGLGLDLGLVVGVVVDGWEVWTAAVVGETAEDFFAGWLVFRWLPT
jgi:hypothetical protein